ncbi:MAG: sigma-70 family RNA polymerase sigma factor [Desulfobacterales bacterium]|nr:sigma-70 family RNA polymerase sigma factor [Desulfobacterales bacterium]
MLASNIDNIEENDLVSRLKQGQEWAFNILVNKYQNMLLKIAYGITLDREESLEIVQDVFVSVHKNIKNFRQDAGLSGWLRKITINTCLNWKRKWERRFRWSHQSIEPKDENKLLRAKKDGNNPETLYREKQIELLVMENIGKLPEKIRVVFVLNTLEGLSYDEIAQHMNIKRGTVSSRLHHARKILLESIKD